MRKKQYHHGDLKNALVQAGIEILNEEGIGALSLRKVAGRAGVSHSAPYAHFNDKQAMIAAISTEGFQRLYQQINRVAEANQDDPAQLLFETAYAYVRFALDAPATFKLMFSGVLEQEKDYPDFVKMSKENFRLLVELASRCQAAGLLHPGPAELQALSLWSVVHGFTALLLERQIPSYILEVSPLKELLRQVLNQVTGEEIVS